MKCAPFLFLWVSCLARFSGTSLLRLAMNNTDKTSEQRNGPMLGASQTIGPLGLRLPNKLKPKSSQPAGPASLLVPRQGSSGCRPRPRIQPPEKPHQSCSQQMKQMKSTNEAQPPLHHSLLSAEDSGKEEKKKESSLGTHCSGIKPTRPPYTQQESGLLHTGGRLAESAVPKEAGVKPSTSSGAGKQPIVEQIAGTSSLTNEQQAGVKPSTSSGAGKQPIVEPIAGTSSSTNEQWENELLREIDELKKRLNNKPHDVTKRNLWGN